MQGHNLKKMEKVDVIFRVWKDSKELFAFFPYKLWNKNTGAMLAFKHGHPAFGVQLENVHKASRKATYCEFEHLIPYLNNAGYTLKIVEYVNHKKQDKIFNLKQ
jgi:hypothetical protein